MLSPCQIPAADVLLLLPPRSGRFSSDFQETFLGMVVITFLGGVYQGCCPKAGVVARLKAYF